MSRTIEFGLGRSLFSLAQAEELGGAMHEQTSEGIQQEDRYGEDEDAGREHAQQDDCADDLPDQHSVYCNIYYVLDCADDDDAATRAHIAFLASEDANVPSPLHD